jgi:hypothetical protein
MDSHGAHFLSPSNMCTGSKQLHLHSSEGRAHDEDGAGLLTSCRANGLACEAGSSGSLTAGRSA